MSDAGSDLRFWDPLRAHTQSRIGQRRAGDTVATSEVLAFREAHAKARDAVHLPVDVTALAADLDAVGLGTPLRLTSAAATRGEYLRRPDLGRRLAEEVEVSPHPADLALIVADGLSTTAVAEHAVAMTAALVEVFDGRLTMAPPVIATHARVALGDAIGEDLQVATTIVMIGERPGLSVDDSLGLYLTHRPRRGRRDSERNCISNVHPPGGLGYAQAARIMAALVDGARALGESGIRLKDSSRDLSPPASPE